MSRLRITIATWDYDRVRALTDGRVKVEGCDVNYITMPVEECFERAFFHGEFEVAEIGFSPYLIALSRGAAPYVAVPVFLSRMFRHSAVYIRTDRGIDGPADLRGKRIGVPEYQMSAVMWVRGYPQGRVRHRGRRTSIGCRPASKLPAGATSFRSTCPTDFRSSRANDAALSAMLADGELDCGDLGAAAVLLRQRSSARSTAVSGLSRRRARLLSQKSAFSRSCTRSASAATSTTSNRWLAASLYKAFLQAKRLADAEFTETTALKIGLPWVTAEYRSHAGRDGRRFLVLRRRRQIARRWQRWRAILTNRARCATGRRSKKCSREGNLSETRV